MVDTAAMESAEWASLNDRQRSQALATSELATRFGQFNQTSYADGAHYAPAAKNPFKGEGLACHNCIFFTEETGTCQVVAGAIEADAVCKLWIIPEQVLMPKAQLSKADLTGMTPEQIMSAKNAGQLDNLLGK